MQSDDITGIIRTAENIIKTIHDEDEKKLTSRLRQVRHYIFVTHTYLERSLETLISRYYANRLLEADDAKSVMHVYIWLSEIFEKLGFSQKADLCKKWELLENKEKEKIMEVNTLRNSVAHTSTIVKSMRFERFNDDIEYCKLIQKLSDTSLMVKNIVSSRKPKQPLKLSDLANNLRSIVKRHK